MQIRHDVGVDAGDVGRRVQAWLETRNLQCETSSGPGWIRIRAQAAPSWKRTIGATPAVEVSLRTSGLVTDVDIRQGTVTGGVWAARYFTYSWIAYGASYAVLKKELEDFIRSVLEGRSDHQQSGLRVIDLRETGRIERPLGTDVRNIDNSASSVPVTRTIKASKSWRQTCQVEVERSRTTEIGLDLSAPHVATLKSGATSAVRDKYAVSEETMQTFEEEISLTVERGSFVQLFIDWKAIVQTGEVAFEDAAGRVFRVAFGVEVGVTFDQRLVDQRR